MKPSPLREFKIRGTKKKGHEYFYNQVIGEGYS